MEKIEKARTCFAAKLYDNSCRLYIEILEESNDYAEEALEKIITIKKILQHQLDAQHIKQLLSLYCDNKKNNKIDKLINNSIDKNKNIYFEEVIQKYEKNGDFESLAHFLTSYIEYLFEIKNYDKLKKIFLECEKRLLSEASLLKISISAIYSNDFELANKVLSFVIINSKSRTDSNIFITLLSILDMQNEQQTDLIFYKLRIENQIRKLTNREVLELAIYFPNEKDIYEKVKEIVVKASNFNEASAYLKSIKIIKEKKETINVIQGKKLNYYDVETSAIKNNHHHYEIGFLDKKELDKAAEDLIINSSIDYERDSLNIANFLMMSNANQILVNFIENLESKIKLEPEISKKLILLKAEAQKKMGYYAKSLETIKKIEESYELLNEEYIYKTYFKAELYRLMDDLGTAYQLYKEVMSIDSKYRLVEERISEIGTNK